MNAMAQMAQTLGEAMKPREPVPIKPARVKPPPEPEVPVFVPAVAADLCESLEVQYNGRLCAIDAACFAAIQPGSQIKLTVTVILPRGWDKGKG